MDSAMSSPHRAKSSKRSWEIPQSASHGVVQECQRRKLTHAGHQIQNNKFMQEAQDRVSTRSASGIGVGCSALLGKQSHSIKQ